LEDKAKADALAKEQADALAKQQAEALAKQQADELAAQQQKEGQAKMYAAMIYDREQQIRNLSPNDSLNKTRFEGDIRMAKLNLNGLGYVYTGYGTFKLK
jgi:hypothetical protein